MGAKTSLLVVSDTDPTAALRSLPGLDRAASRQFAEELFPTLIGAEAFAPETSMGDDAFPDSRLVCAARFPGLDIVCNRDLQIERPSQLAPHLIEATRGRTLYLHAMHSVSEWCAFAVWREGRLVRAVSVTSDQGVIEDIGDRLPFERRYWSGKSLVGHPLELGEDALAGFFGFRLEGTMTDLDPFDIPLAAFLRTTHDSYAKADPE